jgi:hypothetical protein
LARLKPFDAQSRGSSVVIPRVVLLASLACLASSIACQVYDPELSRNTLVHVGDDASDAVPLDMDSGKPGWDSGTASGDAGAHDASSDTGVVHVVDAGGAGADAGTDAGADAATDAGADSGPDAAVDAGADASTDAGADASTDAGADAATDAAADSGPDAAVDAGADAGPDAAADAGDAGSDAAVIDDCPNDATKTAPGLCGCGIPENCAGLISALAHRYRFEGTGTTVVDSVGTAHGKTAAALTGTGSLALAGTSSSYATLPAGLVSASSGATVEFWLTWSGGSRRQKVVSFGTATPTKPGSTCTGSPDFFSGSWYHFCGKDGSMTWSKSRGLCEGAGGYLAAIESAQEDQYLTSHSAFTESVWIGANDLQTEGQWYFANSAGLQGGAHFWSGDENGSVASGAYENWRRDQPNPDDNNSAVDCSFIYKVNNKWWAYGCEFDGSFVCEWRGHQGGSMNRGFSFTPSDNSDRPSLTFQAGASAVVAQGASAFPTAKQTHVALVLDPASNKVALYIDGALAASAASSDPLANLRDVDNWLGRSHITGDPALSGSLFEVRIYSRALSAPELATSSKAGPDPAFL